MSFPWLKAPPVQKCPILPLTVKNNLRNSVLCLLDRVLSEGLNVEQPCDIYNLPSGQTRQPQNSLGLKSTAICMLRSCGDCSAKFAANLAIYALRSKKTQQVSRMRCFGTLSLISKTVQEGVVSYFAPFFRLQHASATSPTSPLEKKTRPRTTSSEPMKAGEGQKGTAGRERGSKRYHDNLRHVKAIGS